MYSSLYQCIFGLAFFNFLIYWTDLFFSTSLIKSSKNYSKDLKKNYSQLAVITANQPSQILKILRLFDFGRKTSQNKTEYKTRQTKKKNPFALLNIEILEFLIGIILWFLLTLLLSFRYIKTHHIPLANFYEALIFLTWGLVTLNVLLLFESPNTYSLFLKTPSINSKERPMQAKSFKMKQVDFNDAQQVFVWPKLSRLSFFKLGLRQGPNSGRKPSLKKDSGMPQLKSGTTNNKNTEYEKQSTINWHDGVTDQVVSEVVPYSPSFFNQTPGSFDRRQRLSSIGSAVDECTERNTILTSSPELFGPKDKTPDERRNIKNTQPRFLGHYEKQQNTNKLKGPALADNLFFVFRTLSNSFKISTTRTNLQFAQSYHKLLYILSQPQKKVYGGILAPCILFIIAFAQFNLSSEFTPLVPALKSNWLLMHVSIMICSYTIFIGGGLLGLILLIQKFFSIDNYLLKMNALISNWHESFPIKAKKNNFNLGILQKRNNIDQNLKQAARADSLITITPCRSDILSSITSSVDKCKEEKTSCNSINGIAASKRHFINEMPFAENNLISEAILLNQKLSTYTQNNTTFNQTNSRISFFQKGNTLEFGTDIMPRLQHQEIQTNKKQKATNPKIENTAKSIPFGYNEKQQKTKANIQASQQMKKNYFYITLDQLSYRMFGIGFPLFTLGILSGAVWANSAWGSYWSWDIKETGSFINWLIIAFYLHCRYKNLISLSHLVAFLSLLVLFFNFFGISLGIFGSSLHAYGAAA